MNLSEPIELIKPISLESDYFMSLLAPAIECNSGIACGRGIIDPEK